MTALAGRRGCVSGRGFAIVGRDTDSDRAPSI